ncbi:hypothetical protein GCM10027589_14260 [Actinocorallia lasiicapitis]
MTRRSTGRERPAVGLVCAALPVLCREEDLRMLAAACPSRAFPAHTAYLNALALTLNALGRTAAEVCLYPLDVPAYLRFCTELEWPPDAPDSRAAFAAEPRLLPPLIYRGEPLPTVLHALTLLLDDERTLQSVDELLAEESANEAELAWMRTRSDEFAAATLPALLTGAGPGTHTLTVTLGALRAHAVATLSPTPSPLLTFLRPAPDAFCDLLGAAHVLGEPSLVLLHTHHPTKPALRAWRVTSTGLHPCTAAELRTLYLSAHPAPATPPPTFKPAFPLPPPRLPPPDPRP